MANDGFIWAEALIGTENLGRFPVSMVMGQLRLHNLLSAARPFSDWCCRRRCILLAGWLAALDLLHPPSRASRYMQNRRM